MLKNKLTFVMLMAIEASLAFDANWIQGAIKRPGAFTAKAKKAGMSVSAFARHVLANKKKYPSRTVRQAALALTLRKISRKRKKKG